MPLSREADGSAENVFMVVDVLRTVSRARRTGWLLQLTRSAERLAPWAVGLFLLSLLLVGAAFPYL